MKGENEEERAAPEGRDNRVVSDRVFKNVNTKMSLPQMCACKANQLYDLYFVFGIGRQLEKEVAEWLERVEIIRIRTLLFAF